MHPEHQKTKERINKPDVEIVFNDGRALRFNKDACDTFSFNQKDENQNRIESPIENGTGRYIVSTRSGNEYFVADGFIIDYQKRKTYEMPDGLLPPDIKFGESWKFGGEDIRTSEVVAIAKEQTQDIGEVNVKQIEADMESPFTRADELLNVAAEKRNKRRKSLGARVVSSAEAEAESNRKRLNLPKGFKTEKGSVYKYTEDAHSERWKFDGTHHEPMGVAVFIEGTPENIDVITRDGVEAYGPPEERFRSYVIESNDDKTKARKIYDARDINNPKNLMFARINGKNEVQVACPVSIEPTIGYHVYEISKINNGKSTNRHPGHKVSEIID